MITETLAILAGLGFGVFIKIADLIVDDGLYLFRHDGYLFGALWGLVGWALVFIDDDTGCVYAALLTYWILRGKLDHPVHHIGGTLLLLAILLRDLRSHFIAIALLLLFYESSYHIKRSFHKSSRGGKCVQTFFRYKSQFFLAPLGLSLVMLNPTPFLTVTANMFGVGLVTHLFQKQVIGCNREKEAIWKKARTKK